MRVLRRAIAEKDGAGSVTMVPDDEEDIWHAYNLVNVGDRVETTAIRKVVRETATGSTSSSKVHTSLVIAVDRVQYDGDTGAIRVSGTNVRENPFVKLGAHHTLELERGRKFTLEKVTWDTIALERVETAADLGRDAEVAAVVMQPGLAHVCLITGHMTLIKAKVELALPRKRASSVGHDKALDRFYALVTEALLRHVDFGVVKCVLVASPGFLKDDWWRHTMDEAARAQEKVLLKNRTKFMLCHASSGHKRALSEVLAQPAVAAQVADTKAGDEVRALERFFELLASDQDRACFGAKHVREADAQRAVETLLLTDALFKSPDFAARRQWVDLVESVRASGGRVLIFSSAHVSGEQLGQLTGVAALLRFPLPLEDDDDASEADAAAGAEVAPAPSAADAAREAAVDMGLG